MAAVVQEIDEQALRALIERVEYAIEHELALEAEDLRLLLSAIHTLMEIQNRLEDQSVTLHKLRKLLGIVSSSEKRSASDTSEGSEKKKKQVIKKPRKPKKPREPAEVIHHSLEGVSKGDPCPECPTGKLQKLHPEVLMRITGSSPFKAVKHVTERLTCNLCGYVARAALPEPVLADGARDQQYGYSARSVMAIFKHFSGIPYFHQETLNDLFDCPITASTIFDQNEYLANDLVPVYRQLKREAADAVLFYIDDTSNRILDQKGEERPNRNGKGARLRTGIYTSGLIAVTASGRRIYLYNTSLGHSGEFIDELLANRSPGLPPPVIMSDALSCNTPSVSIPVILALCNAHARRQWVDIESSFPEEVSFILELYGRVWRVDREAKEQGDNDQQRLERHQRCSLPVMEEIQRWCEKQVTAPDREQHSRMNKACQYFLNHYDGLTQFCKTAGAPLDNNLMEEGLKVKIRIRKSSHYYKTQVGADVANILTSMTVTSYRNECNAFEYLNSVQRNSDAVKASPSNWLPWNYTENPS